MDSPDNGDTVFVTVGTSLPREERALVKGTAIKVDKFEEGTFVVDHEEVLDVGVFGEEVYSTDEQAEKELEDDETGPYGEAYNEEYGKVWSYNVEELR